MIPNIVVGEKTASLAEDAGGKWVSTCPRLKLDPNLSHCTKINAQSFEVDNVTPVAVTLLDKEAGKAFEDKDITKDFYKDSHAQKIRSVVNKWNLMRLKRRKIIE